MTCLQYLKYIDVRICEENTKEIASVESSIKNLKIHLGNWEKSDEIDDAHEFGSYTRGTKLPSCLDPSTDIDFMLVFRDVRLQPQTYLEKVREFGNKFYSRSEVYQDHPTMVIEMQKIKFEIVPSIRLYGQTYPGYQIPGPKDSPLVWIHTYPERMKIDLDKAERINAGLLRPLIRLMKLWNVQNGKPLTSFKIEEYATTHVFFCEKTNEAYVYEAVRWMTLIQATDQETRELLQTARTCIEYIQGYKRLGMEEQAFKILQQLLSLGALKGGQRDRYIDSIA